MSEVLDMSGNSDQAGDDPEAMTLTLNEVLELEDEMIQDAAAVLGASSDKTCSFVEVAVTTFIIEVISMLFVGLHEKTSSVCLFNLYS